MANTTVEALIGGVVLAAAGGFLVWAAHATGDGGGGAGSFELTAAFRKADGLSVGSDVRVAGVKVGAVSDLSLDTATWRAVATLSLSREVALPDDSDAAVATEGLLGGSYVAITPGGSDVMLGDGDEILYTQGSVSILDLVGRAISAAGGD